MKHIAWALALLSLVTLGFGSKVDAETKTYKIKKIVIDAGHGGHDSGALGRFSQEKDIVLQIALELGQLIEQHMQEVEVIYTRRQDEFLTLHDRAQIANRNNADVFISIHCNSDKKHEAACGAETYTMGLHTSERNLRVAKRENASILMEEKYQQHYQGFNPRSPESHILLALYQHAYNKNSLRLAENIQHQLKIRAKRKCRGVRQASFLILWKTTAPSVLVEVGFITNRQEEEYLNSKIGQSHIAASIFKALQNYKEQLETNH